MNIIETHDLAKTFVTGGGKGGPKQVVEAVRGVSFSVAEGEIFGFLGPNGAGKSTTQRMLSTLIQPSGGRAAIAGCDLATQPGEVRKRIGYVGQAGGADDAATPRENLMLQGQLYGLSAGETRERAGALIEALQLGEFADRAVRTASGGQRRRLDIALALVHRPALLFLDEPTTGLDPQARAHLWDEIRALRERGSTIFLTTHYLDEADILCDRLVIVDHGRIIAEGGPRGLIAEHAAENVIEIENPDDDLRRYIDEHAVRHDNLGERIIIYAPREGSLEREIRDRFCMTACLFRSGNLEDVFLRLTGRELRE